MSTFKHIKTGEYQSAYRFMEDHPEANCFYCGKQRDKDEMEYVFLSNREDESKFLGICKICFPDFRIGNLATDRHVVEYILSQKGYKRKVDVLNWFKRQGYELFEASDFGEGDYKGTAYNFINDMDGWNKLQAEISEHGRLPSGLFMNDEESERMNIMFDNATRIEIYNTGGIHIVY